MQSLPLYVCAVSETAGDGLIAKPPSAVSFFPWKRISSQPLLTPPMSDTFGLTAQVRRAPVCVNGTAKPKRNEREKFESLGDSITSAPASVENFPAMKVSGPLAYCRESWGGS